MKMTHIIHYQRWVGFLLLVCFVSASVPTHALAWQIDSGTFWRSTTAYSLTPSGWTNTGATLPGSLGDSQLAIIGEYIYLFGGGLFTNVIYRAPVSNPTAWVNTGATIPGNRMWAQLVVIGNYIYLFGGQYTNINDPGPTNTIYRAPVSDPTAWVNTGAILPGALAWSQVAVVGNYIYLFGGYNGSGQLTNVIYRAPVSDPTAWVNTGATVPSIVGFSQVAVIGEYVYLFGGRGSSAAYNTIYRAPVSDPTAWVNTGATLPSTLHLSTLAIINDYVYLFGGIVSTSPGNASNLIYRAPVSNPTAWVNTGSTLPSALASSQVAVINGYIYLFGGRTSTTMGNVTNVIYRAPLTLLNTAPAQPTITASATGYVGQAVTVTLSGADDPENSTIRYAIDWDNNSTVDAYAPTSGYAADNSTQNTSYTWSSTGVKTYQARSEDSQGGVSAWVQKTITISAAPDALLTATAASYREGDAALTLTWSSSDATSCTGTNFDTDGATSGSVRVTPTATTEYTLTCTNPGGSDVDSETVTYTANQAPSKPTISGPTTGRTGATYAYTITGTTPADPEGDPVRIGLDFNGDDIVDVWSEEW